MQLKRILEGVLAVSLLLWGKFTTNSNLQPELYGMAIGGFGFLIIELIAYLYEERAFLKLYWDCYKPWGSKEIRLTIAYLFRIELNGKYLLVKSARIANTYQPVGGVYKYFYPEAKKELDCIGAITDNKIANDDVSEHDLRLKLLNRKKIISFLKWFSKGEKREVYPWREFNEELVAPGILPSPEFSYIYFELVGQHFEPIHRDKYFDVDTFKYVDIFTPRFISEQQTKEIKNLLLVSRPEYIWVTQQEIKQGKSVDNHLIAEHTHKIFHNEILYK